MAGYIVHVEMIYLPAGSPIHWLDTMCYPLHDTTNHWPGISGWPFSWTTWEFRRVSEGIHQSSGKCHIIILTGKTLY